MTIPKPRRLQCVNDERTRHPACVLAGRVTYEVSPEIRTEGPWRWPTGWCCPECGAELIMLPPEPESTPVIEAFSATIAPLDVDVTPAGDRDAPTVLDPDLPDDAMVIGQVVVTKWMNAGNYIVSTVWSEDLAVLDAVGMLAYAQDSVLHGPVETDDEG